MSARTFPWENSEKFQLARANYMACAYNAAVNWGTGRGNKKMRDLLDAINRFKRVEGAAKLDWLVSVGVIEGWNPCPYTCMVRPGGLFHVDGCENDWNHEVSRERRRRADDMLPQWQTYAASVSLAGPR